MPAAPPPLSVTLQPESDQTSTLVALSMLRLGTDTRGPRQFQETLWPEFSTAGDQTSTAWLTRLAGLLGISQGDRTPRIASARHRAAIALDRMRASGSGVVTRVSPDYPHLLATIPDPPLVLWVDGVPSVLNLPAVAVVGSRSATSLGLELARRLGGGLAEAGLVVVSGLARGIDGAAHRGALDAGGLTTAVLGCGVDVRYPRQHAELAREIAAHGALVSEFPPGTFPYASHFPLRNRIISGLALATVVVEASERSGSLITARIALEQGRDVLAVPGNPLSGSYRGCHALIKDGAGLVETVDDVLQALGWTRPETVKPTMTSKLLNVFGLDVQMVPGEPVSADELAARSGHPVAEWLAQLGALEVAGIVTRTAAGLFVRLDGPATNRER